jgi:hypothetical protein
MILSEFDQNGGEFAFVASVPIAGYHCSWLPVLNLKDCVRAFWQANPGETKFSDAELGSPRFYDLV